MKWHVVGQDGEPVNGDCDAFRPATALRMRDDAAAERRTGPVRGRSGDDAGHVLPGPPTRRR
jgi:hypothetical protein